MFHIFLSIISSEKKQTLNNIDLQIFTSRKSGTSKNPPGQIGHALDVLPRHYNSFSCFLKLPDLLLLLVFSSSLGQNYLHNHPAGCFCSQRCAEQATRFVVKE